MPPPVARVATLTTVHLDGPCPLSVHHYGDKRGRFSVISFDGAGLSLHLPHGRATASVEANLGNLEDAIAQIRAAICEDA